MASGFRWVFWLTPVWLVVMIPAADCMPVGVGLAGWPWLLLLLSVLSVSYPTWNPWTPPWLMDYFKYMGWIL